jgi:hypothetical protein
MATTEAMAGLVSPEADREIPLLYVELVDWISGYSHPPPSEHGWSARNAARNDRRAP